MMVVEQGPQDVWLVVLQRIHRLAVYRRVDVDNVLGELQREHSVGEGALVRRRQVLCRAAALALRRPWLMSAAFGALGRWPGASGYILRRLNAPSPEVN